MSELLTKGMSKDTADDMNVVNSRKLMQWSHTWRDTRRLTLHNIP